jgi:hypothetical protein
VCGRGPALLAKRPAVDAAGDGHPGASVASALFDDLRVSAVAGEADAAFFSAGGDSRGVSAAGAGLLVFRVASTTGLADSAVRSLPRQVKAGASAAGAGGDNDGRVASGLEFTDHADGDSWAARFTGGERVGMGGEVLIKIT